MSFRRTIAFASIIWASSIFLPRRYPAGILYFASFTLPDFLNYLLAADALSANLLIHRVLEMP
jgi:hypothetical protein